MAEQSTKHCLTSSSKDKDEILVNNKQHKTADVLISKWSLGKPAAVDLTITSPLNSTIVSEVGVKAGSAAQAAGCRKDPTNGTKCSELGWSRVAAESMAVGVLKPETL